MPRFCTNSALRLLLALFVSLWPFSAPCAHAGDAQAAPQTKDLPGANSGGHLPPPAEPKGVIAPPPIGDKGIYTDASNPEAGHEKDLIPPPETPNWSTQRLFVQ
jgi:hypothetical protein